MASRILHFGIDERAVLSTLAENGYVLKDCGTSIRSFKAALHAADVDAVVITKCATTHRKQAVEAARARNSLCLIYFEMLGMIGDAAGFDLVIPHFVPRAQWLQKVAAAVEQSRACPSRATSACERATAMKRQARSARERALAAKAELEHMRAQAASMRAELETMLTGNTSIQKVSVAPASRPIRILIVDDHERWRNLVCRMLTRHKAFEIVGAAANGAHAACLAEEVQPDLVLLDISMPGMDGFEAAGRIRQTAPLIKIIFLTLNGSREAVHKALNLGVQGYVLKTDAGRELDGAVQAVLRNETFVSTGVMQLFGEETLVRQ